MFRRNSYKVLLALLALGFVFTMFSVYNQPLDSITGEDTLARRMDHWVRRPTTRSPA